MKHFYYVCINCQPPLLITFAVIYRENGLLCCCSDVHCDVRFIVDDPKSVMHVLRALGCIVVSMLSCEALVWVYVG
jgi:hypothetical protein